MGAREGYGGWRWTAAGRGWCARAAVRPDRKTTMEERIQVGDVAVHYRREGAAPILYVHGVPTAGWQWDPFLDVTGGVAPDLPGFGRSGKPNSFDYSIAGYDRFLEGFTDAIGLERMSLVVHDWGGVGLAFAQRFPERIERLVVLTWLPLMPGDRWHRVARLR